MGKQNEFINAIKCGDIHFIKEELNAQKRSPFKAFMSGGPKGVSKKFNIDFQDSTSLSPLHYAALGNNGSVTKLLINSGAKVDIIDCNGMSPLHLCCWKGTLESLEVLLEAGANVNLQSRSGDTPLHLAAQHGHASVVKILLGKAIAATIKNHAGETVLDLACQYGYRKVVNTLLGGIWTEKFVQVHRDSQSPLMTAARSGRADIVSILIAAGFDINRKVANGTALHEAALFSKLDVVKLLIKNRIDVTIKNEFGDTALDIANKFNSSVIIDEVRSLIEGATLERENVIDTGFSPTQFRRSSGGSNICDTVNNGSAPPSPILANSTVLESEVVIEQHTRQWNRRCSDDRIDERDDKQDAVNRKNQRRPCSSGQIVASNNGVPVGFISLNSKIKAETPSSKMNHRNGRNHQPAHERIGEEEDVDDIALAFDRIANDNAGYIHQLNAMQSIAHQKHPDIIQSTRSVPAFKEMMRSRTRSVAGSKRTGDLEFNSEPLERKERHYSIDFSHDVYTLNPAVDEVSDHDSDDEDTDKLNILKVWLNSIHKEKYTHLLNQAGIDMKMLPYLTVQEYDIIGIKDPSDQRIIFNEALSLSHSPILTVKRPHNVRHWLQLLQLSEYTQLFIDNGYHSISSIMQLTQEDLNDIGIQKLGHVKKILLSKECVKAKWDKNSIHRFSSETNLATYSVISHSASTAMPTLPRNDIEIDNKINHSNHSTVADEDNICTFWKLNSSGDSYSGLRKDNPSSNLTISINGTESTSSLSEDTDINYYSFLSPNLKSYFQDSAGDDKSGQFKTFNYENTANSPKTEITDNPIQNLWDSVTEMQDSLLYTKSKPSNYSTDMENISHGFDKMAESLQSPSKFKEVRNSTSRVFSYCDSGSMRNLANRLTFLSRLDLIYLDALATMFFSTAKEFEQMLISLS